jgi:hypothetical protein
MWVVPPLGSRLPALRRLSFLSSAGLGTFLHMNFYWLGHNMPSIFKVLFFLLFKLFYLTTESLLSVVWKGISKSYLKVITKKPRLSGRHEKVKINKTCKITDAGMLPESMEGNSNVQPVGWNTMGI